MFSDIVSQKYIKKKFKFKKLSFLYFAAFFFVRENSCDLVLVLRTPIS